MSKTLQPLTNEETVFKMDEALTDAGLPRNQLNQLLATVEEQIRCDSDCQRKRDIVALKEKWKKSEQEYEKLPPQIEKNEKNYYTLANGEEYYRTNVLRKRYEEHIKKWEQDQQKKFNEVKTIMRTMLDNYTSETIAKSRLLQLHDDLLNKNKALKRDINDYYKKTFTSERRVYYENIEIDNVEWYRTIIKVFYYALLAVYVLFGSFIENKDYKKWKVWIGIVLYIGFPFVLRYLIDLALDVYTEYF